MFRKAKGVLFFFLWTIISFPIVAQSVMWQEGDILFQDGDCGDFCEAIRKVTIGHEGMDFSHNGLLYKEDGKWLVVEAISKGVSITPLEDFLQRYLDTQGNPKVMVGKIKSPYRSLIPVAVQEALKYVGKPYDVGFDMENDAYYCSELIHFAFKVANAGEDVFIPQPMTYIDPDTGQIFGIWQAYFDKLGIPVPQGEPGLNPGGMSRSEVLHLYGIEEMGSF
jgi:hypothetical protein